MTQSDEVFFQHAVLSQSASTLLDPVIIVFTFNVLKPP